MSRTHGKTPFSGLVMEYYIRLQIGCLNQSLHKIQPYSDFDLDLKVPEIKHHPDHYLNQTIQIKQY